MLRKKFQKHENQAVKKQKYVERNKKILYVKRYKYIFFENIKNKII